MSRVFDYRVPAELAGQVVAGSCVEVPFGHRDKLAGYVVALADRPSSDLDPEKIREIAALLEPEPVWGRELLELAEFLRALYGTTWQSSLQTVVPGPVIARLRAAAQRKGKARKKKSKKAAEKEVLASTPLELNAEQRQALDTILTAAEQGKSVLLYGITGSGKTEVYLQAVRAVLEKGRQAIVLVPEVALTPQAVERYRQRLGETVAVLHSGLRGAARREQWWSLRRGEAQVALGTRSAVFAPLTDLGLVVVDEEHDGSYKQGQDPRYHARQVAAWRTQRSRGAVVLGSATPSLESFYLANQGYYQMAQLGARATGGFLPEVSRIDMRRYKKRGLLLSPELLAAIGLRRDRGEQTVLLLNRRGFSNFLQCLSCGEVRECPDCSISMTYHRSARQLLCHYCDRKEPPPDVCHACGAAELEFQGGGTERLEDELTRAFPGLRVARMDRDSTSKAGAHERILKAFENHQFDVLLGTQMVAKGLDFPAVTLVGVVGADAGLHMPDFRAAERTFALLTQVAGRAGRGDQPGEVLIQAYQPEHPCLELAARHDYLSFYETELEVRRQVGYPPFFRLLRVVISSPEEGRAQGYAEGMARALRPALGEVLLLGPAPCPIHRLRGFYRWHLLLKGQRLQDMISISRNYLNAVGWGESLRVTLDPDPQDLM